MNFKNTLKSSVAAAALFALAAPVTVAADDTLSSGNKNSLKISGQVVKAIGVADDGTSEGAFITDGNWTNSRIRWVSSGKLTNDVTVGGAIEMNIPLSNTHNFTLGDQDEGGTVTDTAAWGIRHQYVYAASKQMGKVYIGQTSGAADGSSEASFDKVGGFAGSDASSFGSSVLFMDTSAAVHTSSTVSVGAAVGNLDHNGRIDLVRYDTPKFFGAQLKGSFEMDGDWEVGATYSDTVEDLKVSVKAGYSHAATSATKRFTATGSIAVLHESGLNASLAGGKASYGNDEGATGAADDAQWNNATDTNFNGIEDPHFYAVAVGYNAKMFGVGGTAFNLQYNQTNDNVQLANHDDNEGEAVAFQVEQQFSAVGAYVGLEYVNYSYESKSNTTDNTFDDIDVITLQTVLKF